MNKRTILIAFLGLMIILGGLVYFVGNPFSPSLAYTIIETGDRQHKEDADYYTVQINYPDKTPLTTRGSWGAENRAQSATASMLGELINQFKQAGNVNGLSQEEKDRLNQAGLKYSLNVGYRPYSSGSFVSYEYDVFMDTGGAHPNNFYKTLVFDMNGNTVSLGDLFTSGSPYLERIAAMAKTQVEAQLAQRAGAEAVESLIADGIAAKEENFANFVVDSDRIRIFIAPYQAAAYAAGSFEVQVPLNEVKDILKEGIN